MFFFTKFKNMKVELKKVWDPKTRLLLSSLRCLLHDSFDSWWLFPKYHFVPSPMKASLLLVCPSLLSTGQQFNDWDQG